MKALLSPPRRSTHLLAAACLALVPFACAHAQSTPGNQYTGVSHPPPDDTIMTSEDAPPPRKPLPGVAIAAAPSAAPPPAAAPRGTVPERTASVQNPEDGIITGTTDPQPQDSVGPADQAGARQNPDYGIVTSTADTPPPAYSDAGAHLVSRPSNPSYGIVGMIPTPANELAEGTDIEVRLMTPLSTGRTREGQEFRAQVAKNIYKDGRVVIPVGSELRGRVVQVMHGHRLGAHATIRLRPDDVILPDGTAYHLYAQAVSVSQPGTRTDDEGGIRTKAHVVKDLGEYGLGAGSGAAVGAAVGGPVGAGAGAIVGAGLTTTHLLLQKPAQARIAEGARIVFSLTEPMDLLPTRN